MSEINPVEDSNAVIIRKRFKVCKDVIKQTVNLSLKDFYSYVINHPKGKKFDCAEGYKKTEKAWYDVTPHIIIGEILHDYMTSLRINYLKK